MTPQNSEIEEVGQAFITLGIPDYSPAQEKYLIDFLSQYAQDLNPVTMKETFKDKIEIIDAIDTLHRFVTHYHNEDKLFNEFKAEIDFLLGAIQGESGMLSL